MYFAERSGARRTRAALHVIARVTLWGVLCVTLVGTNSGANSGWARGAKSSTAPEQASNASNGSTGSESSSSIGANGARRTLASSGLSVERNGEWTRWWQADSAPTRWAGPLDAVTRALTWRRTVSPAVRWGELRLSGSGEAWRVRVIVARIDPRRVHIRLDTAFGGSIAHAAWSIDRAPAASIIAVNAGQFVGSLPWGWVVLGGREFLPPGRGPLSTAVVIDSAGAVHWVQADSLAAARSMRGIAAAFQSYPTLLRGDGDVPEPLQPRFATNALSVDHRDARLAIGQLRDGQLLIALTRFDALDGTFDYVPFGLTTPEMAAVMGALGCQSAVMLDGGISSQMMIRVSADEQRRWRGIRRVPLGLVVVP